MIYPTPDPADALDEPTQPCCDSRRHLADVIGQRDYAEQQAGRYRDLLREVTESSYDYVITAAPTDAQRERLTTALARAMVLTGVARKPSA